jgi:hypothetical protein
VRDAFHVLVGNGAGAEFRHDQSITLFSPFLPKIGRTVNLNLLIAFGMNLYGDASTIVFVVNICVLVITERSCFDRIVDLIYYLCRCMLSSTMPGSKVCCESCLRLWQEYATRSFAEARLARELQLAFQADNPKRVRSLTAELDSVLVFKATVRSSIRSHAAESHPRLPGHVNHAPQMGRTSAPSSGSAFDSAAAFDLDQLRIRLRQMDDCALRRFAKAADRLASPQATPNGSPPHEVFRLQLEEARHEWLRRHPTHLH